MRSIKNLNEKKRALAERIAAFCKENNISAGELSLRLKLDQVLAKEILSAKYEDKELKLLENIWTEIKRPDI